jgi:hypothetical protein
MFEPMDCKYSQMYAMMHTIVGRLAVTVKVGAARAGRKGQVRLRNATTGSATGPLNCRPPQLIR